MPESAAWVPDGRRLLVQARAPGQDVRLYAQDLQGGSPTAISPEGVRLAGSSAVLRTDDLLLAGVRTEPFASSTSREAESEAIRGLVQGERVVGWTADGAGLYVFRFGELPCSVFRLDPKTGDRELWKKLVPPDPAGFLSVQTLCITPDGRSYAYSVWTLFGPLPGRRSEVIVAPETKPCPGRSSRLISVAQLAQLTTPTSTRCART